MAYYKSFVGITSKKVGRGYSHDRTLIYLLPFVLSVKGFPIGSLHRLSPIGPHHLRDARRGITAFYIDTPPGHTPPYKCLLSDVLSAWSSKGRCVFSHSAGAPPTHPPTPPPLCLLQPAFFIVIPASASDSLSDIKSWLVH